jgi:AcrR family transcriptional regulator
MARPREFDEEEVLEQALNVFWEKGYEGTSVDDLVSATGLGRASLYGAFGDKERLFDRVLARYVERAIDIPGALEREGSAMRALEVLFRAWVGDTCAKKGPRGCFLQLAGTIGESTPYAREAYRASLGKMERAFTELITRGQEAGEIPKGSEPAALARFLVVVAQGIASSARAGWGQERLASVVSETLAHIAPRL